MTKITDIGKGIIDAVLRQLFRVFRGHYSFFPFLPRHAGGKPAPHYPSTRVVSVAKNRLVSMETRSDINTNVPHQELDFAYDYLGRRISKIVDGSTNTFIYDGWNLIAEISNTETNYYFYGLDLSGSLQGAGGVGGLVGASFGGTTSVSSVFYAYDGNGNVVGLVDTNGLSVAVYEYDPFGKLIRATGEIAQDNPFTFSSKYQDHETGWLNFGYRFYSPSLGRFASRDPIEEQGGLNLYEFSGNDSVNSSDVLGLWRLVAKGTWLVSQWRITEQAFADVRSEMPNIIREIENGIQKAKDLPECCAYRELLLDRLDKIKGVMQQVQSRLNGSSSLRLRVVYSGDYIAEVQPFLRIVRFNALKGKSASFFDISQDQRAQTILHELTHIEGTDDGSYGLDWWKNAHNLENLYKSGPWKVNFRNPIVLDKGMDGCNGKRWPDN